MHEYAIAEELIAAVQRALVGREVEQVQVKEVHLRKGELRLVADEALQQAYRLLTVGTPLEGSKLWIEEVKVEVGCRSCGYRGPAEYRTYHFHFAAPILECPCCGAKVELIRGRELELVGVTVAVPEEVG